MELLPRKPPISPNLLQYSHPESPTLVTGLFFSIVSRTRKREKELVHSCVVLTSTDVRFLPSGVVFYLVDRKTRT